VLLLFLRGHSLETVQLPGGTIPPHDGNGPVHITFSIAADELAVWEERLKAKDIAIEGRTKWPRGGESIYFRDPDGHLLELATPGLWAGYWRLRLSNRTISVPTGRARMHLSDLLLAVCKAPLPARSLLRHPGLAHAIIEALALREVDRIVAVCARGKRTP
jgi:hypothetical protein